MILEYCSLSQVADQSSKVAFCLAKLMRLKIHAAAVASLDTERGTALRLPDADPAADDLPHQLSRFVLLMTLVSPTAVSSSVRQLYL